MVCLPRRKWLLERESWCRLVALHVISDWTIDSTETAWLQVQTCRREAKASSPASCWRDQWILSQALFSCMWVCSIHCMPRSYPVLVRNERLTICHRAARVHHVGSGKESRVLRIDAQQITSLQHPYPQVAAHLSAIRVRWLQHRCDVCSRYFFCSPGMGIMIFLMNTPL